MVCKSTQKASNGNGIWFYIGSSSPSLTTQLITISITNTHKTDLINACITPSVLLIDLYKLRNETKRMSVVINRMAQMWSRDTEWKTTQNPPEELRESRCVSRRRTRHLTRRQPSKRHVHMVKMPLNTVWKYILECEIDRKGGKTDYLDILSL